MTKMWIGDLFPAIAEAGGADIDDEVRPIVGAFIGVLSQTLARGESVGVIGLGTFEVDGQQIRFRPARGLLENLRRI